MSNKKRDKILRRLKAKHLHELKRRQRQSIEKRKTWLYKTYGIELPDTKAKTEYNKKLAEAMHR